MKDFARSDDPAVQAQLDRLTALSVPDGRLGLETIRALCARLGDPQNRLPPVFHVAGTNGKGSTCAFLRAMLEEQGYTVHVTTSPHLVRYNERIRLAGTLIDDDRLAELLGSGGNEVTLAGPSVFQQVAISAPLLLLEVMLTFLMAFFLVEARSRLRRNILFGRTTFGTSVKAARVLREVQDRVAAYILTVAWINLGVGIVVALGAWAMDLPAPIMWGGLATLLNFVPYIGPLAMTALLTLFGLGTADTVFLGLIPPISYVALHVIEANAVTPAILGRRFTMNPVMILLAFSYFSWIWGAVGALLSVPILLMVTAFFDHVGRPNLVGFIFGEPLFQTPLIEDAEGSAEETRPA